MKTLVNIRVRPQTISPSTYQELCEKFPCENSERSFSKTYLAGSREIAEIVSILEAEGLAAANTSIHGKYKLTYHRQYEESDFWSADYLRILPKDWVSVGAEGRDANGRVIIDSKELYGEFTTEFRAGFSQQDHFVSELVKQLLGLGQFSGLQFRETVWADPIRDFKRERVWEMYSDIVLPKLSNIQNLVHAKNEPFSGDYSRPIYVKEKPYAQGGGELHYRARDLRPLEPFDIASTFELHCDRRHSLVASPHVYAYCNQHQLPFTWQPVRIDPD